MVRSVIFRVRSVNLCKLQYPHMAHDNNYIPTWQYAHTTISHDNANLPCQCEQCGLRLCSLSQQGHTHIPPQRSHVTKAEMAEGNQLTGAFYVLWSLTNYGPNQHILSLLTIFLFYYLQTTYMCCHSNRIYFLATEYIF